MPALQPDDCQRKEVVRRRATDEWTLEFHPARWLLAALVNLRLWLVHATLGKRALRVFAWRFIPRRLKLIAGGVAALALVVLAGSVAALMLVLT